MPIDPEVLVEAGWERRPGIVFLRSQPRLGWALKTHELIIGYASTIRVDDMEHLREIMDVFRIKEGRA